MALRALFKNNYLILHMLPTLNRYGKPTVKLAPPINRPLFLSDIALGDYEPGDIYAVSQSDLTEESLWAILPILWRLGYSVTSYSYAYDETIRYTIKFKAQFIG